MSLEGGAELWGGGGGGGGGRVLVNLLWYKRVRLGLQIREQWDFSEAGDQE